MAAISGTGGTVQFTPHGLTTEFLSISTWELDGTAIKSVVSPSGAGCGQRMLMENNYYQWAIATPLDSTEFPVDIGLEEGQILSSIYFSLGAAVTGTTTTFQLYDKLVESMVETIGVVDDVNGALQLRITGCGGAITRGVTG